MKFSNSHLKSLLLIIGFISSNFTWRLYKSINKIWHYFNSLLILLYWAPTHTSKGSSMLLQQMPAPWTATCLHPGMTRCGKNSSPLLASAQTDTRSWAKKSCVSCEPYSAGYHWNILLSSSTVHSWTRGPMHMPSWCRDSLVLRVRTWT